MTERPGEMLTLPDFLEPRRKILVIPKGILLIIVALSIIEPLTHLWLQYGLPDEMAHTGFHIGDTPFFLTSMKVFQNDFFSPYITCQAPGGDNAMAFFALPHHWVYATLGVLCSAAHIEPFIGLGLANGFCAFLFLWSVYYFLRVVSPRHANRAFLLFTLGGGLGGVLYLVFGILGLQDHANFEAWFHRYARYELIEGPFLSPVLVLPRLYYVLPLAIGFAAVTGYIQRVRQGKYGPGMGPLLGLLLTTYLNARLGPLFWLIIFSFLWTQSGIPLRRRLNDIFLCAMPVIVASILVMRQFSGNPTGAENVSVLLRRAAWYSSLFSVVFWHLLCLPYALRRRLPRLPHSARCMAWAALGYLAVFSVLYLLHQAYYGNWYGGGDTAAAIKVSDWALIGAYVTIAYALFRRPDKDQKTDNNNWVVLWFLGFLAVSISAFGGGLFMRLMPERCMVLLGVPMALLSAEGLARMGVRHPRMARGLFAIIIACGMCSIGVASLCFQGPLGRSVDDAAFNWVHSEIMSPDDARLIARLPEGNILAPASAPPLLGDVIVEAHGVNTTVFGQPSLEFGGYNMENMIESLQEFFSENTHPLYRTIIIEDQCVEYVYCPATRPVSAVVLDQLQEVEWLEEIDREGEAVLFRVMPELMVIPQPSAPDSY
jgi:hypothetical protein